MTSILSYQFFQNALWASLFTAIVCGLVGSYIVVRRMVFISGGITHASFGGLGLGLYLGFDPMLG
ncbi:metal ABC transporter permease, partial [Staphylococcus aureus]|uniref:metal ABC transporter permease n=2 Tax=Bacteria TaxID=2 RepID=UPI003D3136BF|nr:metal ABC transporter permease [Staphylococcus aureus]